MKTKGARRITFAQFVDALGLVAAKKGMSLAAVVSAVLAADGPSVTGTRADYVKFHDDKVSSRHLARGILPRLPQKAALQIDGISRIMAPAQV